MPGLRFEEQPAIVESAPSRSDVACFVGFVARRETPVPGPVVEWLEHRGWLRRDDDRQPVVRYPHQDLAALLDLPVPLESWDQFDRLFAWDRRPLGDTGQSGTTYLGAAVRSFFAQGGRKCYVVRVGDPWPYPTDVDGRRALAAESQARLARLIPGYPTVLASEPAEQRSWRGMGHVLGLPDVAMLCLPDLPDLVATDPLPPAPLPPPLPLPEAWVECGTPAVVPGESPPTSSTAQGAGPSGAARLRAPRCDQAGYGQWARALNMAGQLIARHRREVQLIAALPLPQPGSPAERHLLGFLIDQGRGPLAHGLDASPTGLASAFLQLAFPWVGTAISASLPEQAEPPDGVLAGILAHNALEQGAFRSAAGRRLGDVHALLPRLDRAQLLERPLGSGNAASARALVERVTTLGETPDGLRLLSDVTTSLDESYRLAGVNRLVAILLREARRQGEGLVFETSGERLWAAVQDALNRLLLRLLQAGALRGRSPEEAFQVRCDRSTMTQNDLDNGRLVAQIQFDAAATVEEIAVVLAMDEGGQVSLASPGG
ncbi:hypothetical protein [Litorilinea aerophila]|uniref:Phage tail sheath protein n=1 Tax=Litorilinea aerophila TaxID=1204385 RepID=A0A540VFN0_9CHLR|nr:hypothetical protein [Litorilinea aerophila]GIV76640.1 MAG: hypothetical protein KatS3mg050_1034 [Litorilinea sp.]